MSSLFMVRPCIHSYFTLKKSHDLSRNAEVGMADHFGSGSDMKINLIEIFDFFYASESDTVGFVFGNALFVELFLHDMFGKSIIISILLLLASWQGSFLYFFYDCLEMIFMFGFGRY
jgi:hypothetical protein